MSERLAVLLQVLRELNIPPTIGSKRERKRLQKAIYLAQAAGVPLGYQFGWYINGPYSSSLAGDYYALNDMLTQRAAEVLSGRLRSEVQSELRTLATHFSPPSDLRDRPEDWLELLASTHFLSKRSGYPLVKVKHLLQDEKPHIAGYLDAAWQSLRKASLVT